jgi:WD40 repeat protein
VSSRRPGRWAFSVALWASACGLLGPVAGGAVAQEQIRRFADPILVVNTGGHSAPVRALLFTPDGSQLLSSGMDKVVNVWDLGGGHPHLSRTLRPLIWRGPRGAIYALALSQPDARGQRTLALAGYGVADALGNIALYRFPGVNDVPTGDIEAQLMNGDPREPDPLKRSGHVDSVTDLAFNPRDGLLASAGLDQTVRLWDVRQRRQVAVLGPHGSGVSRLTFTPDGLRLLTAAYNGVVRLWDVNRRLVLAESRPAPVRDPAGLQVNALAVSPDGRWVVIGRENGQLLRLDAATLRNGVNLPTNPREQGAVEALAFSRDGSRLVTSIVSHGRRAAPNVRPPVECDVEVRSMPDGVVRTGLFSASPGALNPPLSNLSYAVAFSLGDRYLAVAGGDTQSVYLVDLQRPGLPFVELRGQGQSVWDVAFSADSRSVAFTRRPPGAAGAGPPEGFDLAGRAIRAVGQEPLTRASDTLQGWKIRPVDPWHLEILDPRGVSRQRLVLDGQSDRRWWSYGFIPPFAGRQPRALAAVGCEAGVILFDAATGQRVRYLVGHTDKVYALAPSPDGLWLATGSSDQTVRLWLLEGRDQVPGLGATFGRTAGGGWVVTRVEPRGFADGMGLREKDVVESFRVDNVEQRADQPPGALADRAPPGRSLFFRVRREGQAVDLETTKRDTPALTLFPGLNREWVLWMPDGYYDTSIAGDRRHLGFHLNRDQDPARMDQPTDFFPVDRYERRFRRTEVLTRLIETASVAEALRELPPDQAGAGAGGVVPAVPAQPPVVRLLDPPLPPGRALELQAADRPLRVRVTNKAPGRVASVRVLIDGWVARELPPFDPPVAEVEPVIPLTVNPGRSQVNVTALNDQGVEGGTSFEVLLAAPPRRTPRQIVVAVGAERFRKPFPEVKWAGRDAQDLGVFLTAPDGRKRFERPESRVLKDEEATAGRLGGELDRLDELAQKKELGVGDAVFVVIESHFLTYDGRGLVVGTDVGEEAPPVPSLPAGYVAETLGRLAATGCRVVLLVDGLHRPASREKADRFKDWVRDLYKTRNVIVFVASKDEPSRPLAAHRAFAEAVLTSFDVRRRSRLWVGPRGPVTLRDFRQTVIDGVAELAPGQFADGYIPDHAVNPSVRLFEPQTSER